MEFHIVHQGTELGPLSEEAVRELLRSGGAADEDLAWCTGRADWAPLSSVLPAPESVPKPAAAASSSGAADRPAAGEPATEKQKALLAYMNIPFDPGLSREAAALLVAEAIENPKDPLRLARWNRERLVLHPELFAAEVQARKEARAQEFFTICQEQGAALFPKITKAHCQVLVAYLDVEHPNWDANEGEAAERYFFPAIAKKFPQLLTPAAKNRFKASSSPSTSGGRHSAKLEAKPPSRFPVQALVRGVVIGGLILAVLWGADAWRRDPQVVAAWLKHHQTEPAAPAPGDAKKDPAQRGDAAVAKNAPKAPSTAAVTKAPAASGPAQAPSLPAAADAPAATSPPMVAAVGTEPPPPAAAPAATGPGAPPPPAAAGSPPPPASMDSAPMAALPASTAPPPAALPGAPPAAAAPDAPAPEAKPSLFNMDLPTNPGASGAPPAAGGLIPAASAPAALLLTKPVEIALPYGKVKIPAGTPVKLLQQSGDKVTIQYLTNTATVPISSTNLPLDAQPVPAKSQP